MDLTSLMLDSDSDGSRFSDVDNDDDAPDVSQEQSNLQMVISEDGRFESFKSPNLMASVVTGRVNSQGKIEKMVKVSVKWGRLATKQNEKKQTGTATATSQNDAVASDEKFEVNEKIYAVDNGVRFEATVLKCGDDPVDDDGEDMKYHVQIKSFKNSYKKWLSAENMKKRVVGEVGMEFKVETDEEDDDGEVEVISTKPGRKLRSRKKSPRSSPSNQEDQGESNCMIEVPTSQRGAEDIYNMQTDEEREEEVEVQVISTSKSKSPVLVTPTRRRSPRKRSMACNEAGDNTKEPKVGMRVNVCFKDGVVSLGNNFYGTITKVSRAPQRKQNTFTHHIKIMYDDGEEEETYYPDPDITLDSSNKPDAQPKAAGPNESIGSNLFSKDGDGGKDEQGDKQRGMRKKDPAKTTQQGNASETRNIQPEAVKSSTGAKPTGYDKADYEILKQRYLMPRVREKAELANGITLRRQFRDRLIDQKTPGFKLLKTKVDSLLKKNYHAEVYRLLCQLRDWELNPERTPAAFHEGNRCDGDVEEVLDLTKEDDGPGKHCIDVDEYITDVLLVDVTKEGDGKQSPLLARSSTLPEATHSSNQARLVSFDDPPSRDRGNSDSAELSEDLAANDSLTGKECQSSTNNIHQVHITNAAIEVLDTFVNEVIANISQLTDSENDVLLEVVPSSSVCHGSTVAVNEDSGKAICKPGVDHESLVSLISQVPPVVSFGHPKGVFEGMFYSRRYLYSNDAHRAATRGINGNLNIGADSIIVSRQCPQKREEDGEYKDDRNRNEFLSIKLINPSNHLDILQVCHGLGIPAVEPKVCVSNRSL